MSTFDFCDSIRFSYGWNSLKYKYEYNINSSEFHLYQYLSDQVETIEIRLVNDLKLKYKLSTALARVHGFAFCDNGYAGWNAIKEYFDSKNININIEEIKLRIIKDRIKSVRHKPDDDFFDYALDMFSDSPRYKESKLVKECYNIIKSLQPLKNNDMKLFYELSEKAINELETKSKETLDVIHIDINNYIPTNMPKFIIELAENDKKDFIDGLEEIFNDVINEYPDNTTEEHVYSAIFRLLV